MTTLSDSLTQYSTDQVNDLYYTFSLRILECPSQKKPKEIIDGGLL